MQPPIPKDKHRNFIKSLFVDLCNIKNESLIGFPRFTESVLTSCHGNKMYELLLAFSSYVIYKTLEEKDIGLLAPPILTEDNYNEITETLKTAIISSASEMQTLIKISDTQVKVSLNFAKALTVQFQKLKVILANKEAGLLEASNSGIMFDANQPNNDARNSMKDCTLHLQKIQMYWDILEEFLNSENEMWSGIYPVTEEKQKKCVLRGPIINAPSAKGKNEEDSLKRSLTCINAFLERYLEIYKSSDLSNIHIEDIEEDKTVIEIYRKLKPLRESLLSLLLPNLRESTEKLKEKMLLLEEKSAKTKEAEWMFPDKSLVQYLETSEENTSLLLGCEDDRFNKDISEGPSTSTLGPSTSALGPSTSALGPSTSALGPSTSAFQSSCTDKDLKVEECSNIEYAGTESSKVEKELGIKPLSKAFTEFQVRAISDSDEEDSIFRPDVMMYSDLSCEDDLFNKDISGGPSTSTLGPSTSTFQSSCTDKDLKVEECSNIGYAVTESSKVEKELGIKPWSKAFTEFQDRATSDSEEDSIFRPDVMIDSDLNESDL